MYNFSIFRRDFIKNSESQVMAGNKKLVVVDNIVGEKDWMTNRKRIGLFLLGRM